MLRIEVFAEGSPRINFHRSHGALRFNEGQTRRSEEHTSELQSQSNLVCRLLLEKKKKEHSIRSEEHTYDLKSQWNIVFCVLVEERDQPGRMSLLLRATSRSYR